jgi:hypothetical protein
MTWILTWLGNLLGGPFAKAAVDAYKARLDVQNSSDARAADLASKAIEAEIDARRSAVEVRKAEGAWGPIGIIMFGFGVVTLAYYGKVVVWDVMLGWGSTDAIRGAVGEWMNTIIISLFGSGTVTAVARMALTRLGR